MRVVEGYKACRFRRWAQMGYICEKDGLRCSGEDLKICKSGRDYWR